MNKRNVWFWTSPIIFGVLVMSIIRLVNDVPKNFKFWERSLYLNLIEILSVIIIFYVIQLSLLQYIKRQKAKEAQLTLKKLISEYLFITLSGMVIAIPSIYFVHLLTGEPVYLEDLVIAEIVSILLIVIYYSIFRGGDLLQAYVNQKTLTQQIENTQMETELKFLKVQFHPHFLFNALNAIYFQIDEKNEAPRKSIEQLAELLRYQLYDINQTVKIEQELDFIRNYTEFQKVRMPDSFRLTVRFDPDLHNQQIHPLLLFPLVENAYKYVGGRYIMNLEARLHDGKMYFTVENAIPQIPQVIKNKDQGIGLENLRRRLNLLYPGKHSFETTKTSDSFIANLIIEW
jgi:two-component system LytT family sensor kinase